MFWCLIYMDVPIPNSRNEKREKNLCLFWLHLEFNLNLSALWKWQNETIGFCSSPSSFLEFFSGLCGFEPPSKLSQKPTESGIFQLHQQLNFSSFGNTFFAEISEYRYTAIQSMPSKLTPTRSGHYRLLQPLCKGLISSYAFSNCQQLTGYSLPTSI